jgi:hypothetical protein
MEGCLMRLQDYHATFAVRLRIATMHKSPEQSAENTTLNPDKAAKQIYFL